MSPRGSILLKPSTLLSASEKWHARGIMTEYSSLQRAYERSGRDGLIALIQQRIADESFADNVYILVDPSLAALGGNLKAWPSTATAASGWTPHGTSRR